MKKSVCRGCGAKIVWIATILGKNMPCNPEPVLYWEKEKAPGKVITPHGRVISCVFEGDADKATGKGYISHFSTCAKARSFKK